MVWLRQERHFSSPNVSPFKGYVFKKIARFGFSYCVSLCASLFVALCSGFGIELPFKDRFLDTIGFIGDFSVKNRFAYHSQGSVSYRSKCLSLEQENIELRSLLRLNNVFPYKIVCASVIRASYLGALVVMPMTRCHANIGSPVLLNGSLYGVVQSISTNENYAHVLSICNAKVRVPIVGVTSKAKAILQGQGTKEACLCLQEGTFKKGEQIITSGIDSTYPKGISIGEVKSQNSVKLHAMSNAARFVGIYVAQDL